MKKRLSAYFSLFIATIVLLVTILTPIQLAAAADDDSQGSRETAINKLWYSALSSCINNIDYWYQPSHNDDDWFKNSMEISDLQSGRWFATNDQLEWTHGMVGTVWGGGAYIENETTGSYKDGKIYCGENDNALVKQGLQALGLSYLDVLCNYSDDHFSSGVLYVDTSKTSCSTKFADTDGEWAYWNSDRANYFNQVVSNRTFGGNVPGGSLDTLTYLEAYYVRLLTFQTACAADNGNFGHAMDYTIVGWNPNANGGEGRFEQVGYSQKNSGGTEVWYWGGNKATCQELADSLDVGSAYFNAFRDKMLQPAIDGCIDKYNEARDEIKIYKVKYEAAKEAARFLKMNIKNMLDKLEKNSFPTMAYVDTINSQYDYDNAKFSPPVVQSYNEKISGYFQRAIEGVDGTAVINQNVLNQLKAASDSIIAASEIDDNGVVTSIAPAEDFEQAREWIDKIDEELTRALQNITKIASFLNETDTSNVTPWAYEDSQEINITCPGLEELKNLKDEMLGDLEGVPDIDGEFHQTDFLDPDQVEENIQIDPCYNAGLESMAWILCPTLNNSKNAVSLIDSLIEDWLSVSTNIYSMQDEDNNLTGAYIAWSYIRGIANVAMIIILLFIIFSQLTGYGIDNYGIKKMLPKLIIVAILINLSFLICELVIDLSNIVGSGINQIFRTIGKDIIGTGSESLIEGFVGHVITILFAAVGVVGAVAPVAISVIGVAGSEGGGVMIVILIVLALLVVLAAILLFFIMLGARMVIIILCTALSPLAFVCYVMPNTQGIYKKWWNLFKGALIMFPICGAIGGIGYMVKAIVLTTSGVHLWMMVFAIIVPYLPMFLLPSLLKGAIAGLGKVGATLSTLGNQFRNGAKGVGDAVQNTDRYKDRLQFAKDSAAAARAQRVHDRLSGRTGLTRSQQDRLRRADDVILAQRKRERENALRTDGAGYFNAMSTKQDVELAGETAAVERYNDQGYRAAAEASIASKAVAAATSDQEALLTNGRAALNTGGFVNTNDAGSVGQYHREALARYRAATTEAERSTAMAQVRAAQNILSKTDKGRAEVAGNLATALRNGETAGLQDAASHLMSEYGDKYKSVNRGSHAMISDLSTTMDFNANLAGLQAKLDQIDANGDVIQSGAYSMAGTNKYTAESLVGADDSALDSFITSIQNNSLTGDSLTDLQSTAYKALDMKRTGTLSIKPEVEKKLQQIVGNFVPQDIAAQQAVQQAAAQAAQQQFDSITRNLDEINQQLHQHGNPQNGPQGGPDTFDGGAGI